MKLVSQISDSRNRDRVILAIIVALALLIRVLAASSRQMVEGDETVYLHMAQQLAAGNGFIDMLGNPSTVFMPMLPALIAASAFVLRDFVFSGYFVVIVFGSMLLVPAYMLASDLVTRRVGLMTAALIAVLPLTVDYSSRSYTEPVYSFFLLFAAVCALRMFDRGSLGLGALAGVLLGAAYLTNPAAVFFVPAFLVIAAVTAARRASLRTAMIRAALGMLAVFIILALPYVLYLHNELGRWTYSGKNASSNIAAAIRGQNLATPEYEREAMSLTEDGQDIVEMVRLRESSDPLSYFLAHPRTALRLFSEEVRAFYHEEAYKVMPVWLLLLSVVGLVLAAWRRERVRQAGYPLLLMSPLLLILTIDHRARFFMPYVPLMMIWAASGWEWIETRGSRWVTQGEPVSSSRRLALATSAVLALVIILPTAFMTQRLLQRQSYSTHFKDAGEWIRDNGGSGKRVMNRDFSSAFYADGTAVLLPYADYSMTTNYARQQEADYLVVSRQALHSSRPELGSALESEGGHPDWQLEHTVRPGTAEEVLVYALRS
jgi:4-amino-4-deoxy-L-arabinose transferase-like glycosyltransferase